MYIYARLGRGLVFDDKICRLSLATDQGIRYNLGEAEVWAEQDPSVRSIMGAV